ncbi:hypothetical protein ZWY2020_042389 [Hordeum vulgare]|nr:hypothetical protein ZWY2020_042389 [Hordeum vulgare]
MSLVSTTLADKTTRRLPSKPTTPVAQHVRDAVAVSRVRWAARFGRKSSKTDPPGRQRRPGPDHQSRALARDHRPFRAVGIPARVAVCLRAAAGDWQDGGARRGGASRPAVAFSLSRTLVR